jgi:hypothetical protein
MCDMQPVALQACRRRGCKACGEVASLRGGCKLAERLQRRGYQGKGKEFAQAVWCGRQGENKCRRLN